MKEKNSQQKTKQPLHTVLLSGKKDDSFFQQVYDIARQVPKGRVTSYGAIAKCIGTGKSARMVGWAMNGSGKIKPKVPAHRVVNSLGILTGKFHFSSITKMEELLANEGVKVRNDKVVDFKKIFWDPAVGLQL